jgi:hypothetical protein
VADVKSQKSRHRDGFHLEIATAEAKTRDADNSTCPISSRPTEISSKHLKISKIDRSIKNYDINQVFRSFANAVFVSRLSETDTCEESQTRRTFQSLNISPTGAISVIQ